MIFLYNFLLILVSVLLMPMTFFLLAQSRRRATVMHRLGFTLAEQARAAGLFDDPETKRPIWIHALSLGEVLSAVPIIEQLAADQPNVSLVFSASTKTGFASAKKLFAEKVQAVIYLPYDFIFSVRHTIDIIDPCLVVIVETDIWPNFLYYIKKKKVPILLANTRLSDRTYRRFRKGGGITRWILSMIDRFGVQSVNDANRFKSLGTPGDRIHVTGNIKFDQCHTSSTLDLGSRIRRTIGLNSKVPIIVAGSTHAGEEETLLSAYLNLRKRYKDLVLVLTPRDPDRAAAIAELCDNMGAGWQWLSRLDKPIAGIGQNVLIVNTAGILRDLYSLADVSFIGGTLVPFGGHNPLEPAVFAKPIIFGPHMHDFRAIAALLLENRAAIQIRGAADLKPVWTQLLSDQVLRENIGARARKVLLSNQGATQRTMLLIKSLLINRS